MENLALGEGLGELSQVGPRIEGRLSKADWAQGRTSVMSKRGQWGCGQNGHHGRAHTNPWGGPPDEI